MSISSVAPDHAAKLKAWRQQHGALAAPRYRITLVGRVDSAEARTFNLGKRPKGEPEKLWDADEVECLIPQLRRHNVLGFDVYLTPIDPGHHYIVVDDMKPRATKLLAGMGYAPCLVQSSSYGNEQAVLKVTRQIEREDEPKLANKVVQQLNMAYGDQKFSGVIHPFRMAGFSNKKPGRAAAFTVILLGSCRLCGKTAQALQALRDEAVQRASERAKPARCALARAPMPNLASGERGGTEAANAFCRATLKVHSWVRSRGLPVDHSRVDYRAAIAMFEAGWPPEEVRQGMLAGSEGLADRHRNPADYVARTVRKAEREFAACTPFFPRRRRGGGVALPSEEVRDV